MIVLATELASTQPYRFGPLDEYHAQQLVERLAVSGAYSRVQLIDSDDIDATVDERKRSVA
jgi:hypothetical protein